MTALVHMTPDQERYFKDEVVPPFEKRNHAKIDVIHYETVDSLGDYLQRYAGRVGLVKVPFEASPALMQRGIFKRLDAIVSAGELAGFTENYLLTNLGASGGKPCLIPRMFETRIMVYCKSKVTAALANWRQYKSEIETELKKYNGSGLPSSYSLGEDPGTWNFYDLFVVGWVWSHTLYKEKMGGRIGFCCSREAGTWVGFVDRIFQLGGDSAAVVTMSGDAVVDAMHWEAVYAASGVYNARMWEKGWGGADLWQAFADGEVFLSFVTQQECFFLHGTGRDHLTGFLKNPDDLGVALMPQGCSVELAASGSPARTGSRSVATGGWWWGIPESSPDPALSYRFVLHITSAASQIQECTRFGMVPVRKDVLGDISMLFGGSWIARVYEVSFLQLMRNGATTLPAHPRIGTIGNLYIDIWYDIVAGKNWSSDKILPDRAFIRNRIATVYRPNAVTILAGKE